jgi:hypothetical protein
MSKYYQGFALKHRRNTKVTSVTESLERRFAQGTSQVHSGMFYVTSCVLKNMTGATQTCRNCLEHATNPIVLLVLHLYVQSRTENVWRFSSTSRVFFHGMKINHMVKCVSRCTAGPLVQYAPPTAPTSSPFVHT